MISQQFTQYYTTLRENVAISNITASSDDRLVREALQRVDFDQSEIELDQILGTEFGGTELSGGQW